MNQTTIKLNDKCIHAFKTLQAEKKKKSGYKKTSLANLITMFIERNLDKDIQIGPAIKKLKERLS